MTRLGELERAVMDVLWDAPSALTGREVAAVLAPRDLAYTTVLTVLTRLQHKGLVDRDSSARSHSYLPTATREDHVALLMRQALGEAEDRAAALQHFARSVTADEALALRRALDGRG